MRKILLTPLIILFISFFITSALSQAPPTIETYYRADGGFERRDTFAVGENVFAMGGGYPFPQEVRLHVTHDQNWASGQKIVPIWTYPLNVQFDGSIFVGLGVVPVGYYDIVVDVNRDGDYDADVDALDDGDVNGAGFRVESGWFVGGFVVPVDKLALLAPYIGFASTVLVAIVATAVYVKRVKLRKERQ
jgi:hypothetical protein